MTRCHIRLLVTLALTSLVAPLAVRAQPERAVPLIGVLRPGYASADAEPTSTLAAFRQGLRELGYVEGQTIRLEYRFAEWQQDRLPSLAAELVRLTPDVLVTNTTPAALAVQRATATIPIVIALAPDLVEDGLVASLERPGGNVTGQSLRDLELAGKRLQLLKEAIPHTAHVAVLTTTSPSYRHVPGAFAAEARALGVRLQRVDADDPGAFDDAFATMATMGADALMIMDSSLFNQHRQPLLALARTHRLPTVCGGRPYAEAGCLVSYSPNHVELFRRAARFVDKILKGAQPADLPVERPDTFELVINLKAAQALGLTMPPSLLFQATEVLR